MTKTENIAAEPLEALASPLLNVGAPVDLEFLKTLADDAGTDLVTYDNVANRNGLPVRIPVLIDRKTGAAKSVKSLFEEWRTSPERKSGTATVNTLESFTALTNRHKTEHSAIFANTDWRSPSLTAVIDYHEKASAGYADNGRHRIHYPFPLTEEWEAWIGITGKPLDQAQFAEFIEDHRAELAAPHEEEVTHWEELLGGKLAAPNEMQMLSRGLKVNSEVKVSSAVTLSTGEGELTWEETHQTRNNAGAKIIVPSLFMIALPPFYQGEKTRLPVRLRYRVTPGGGAVKWIIIPYRPDIYVTEEVIRVMERAADETELPAFQGSPETAG
ncbi:hypothetical protein DEM27_00020 [Metarhizobium album]|uniref:DUF2303 domain-containing protein n=1 Tax=Metarhizobium album TaxID=2182425 RepID=A0A2U2DWD6_9HYPH|nr:DUF2303 family protein [Rhizobium album]PWE57638.1 hypothetical protein DEM27_00020 [Rhizobium album]